MQRHATPPSGPRGRGHPTRSVIDLPRPTSRGGVQKRRTPQPRTDRDGDLNMDAPVGASGGGAGRGRGGRARGSAVQSNGDHTRGRTATGTGPQRGLFSGVGLQKAIARGLAAGEATIKPGRDGINVAGVLKEISRRGRAADHPHDLDQISVRGLRQSKAAANPDGGVKDLLSFLERKATGSDPAAAAVRIRKSRMEGDAMIVSVRKEDAPRILRLNTFVFAGAPLTIEVHYHASASASASASGRDVRGVDAQASEAATSTRELLTAVLTRRYDAALKLLDLSSLGKDPDLVSLGTFNTNSTSSKFFPALMLICDSLFTDEQQKRDAVVSVSLANNELKTISTVTTLAQTFPDVKNIDLSHNRFETMGALGPWRWKFRHLDHLVLSGNPMEKVEPNYKDDVMRWYPTLRMLNTVQVRTDEDIASMGKLPLPTLGASFRDEGQIAETFIKQFFPAFDTDRTTLVNTLYDAQSTFSYSINTSAPRAALPTGADATTPITWDTYIKGSRNLSKITHLPARISRAHVGPESIRQRWNSLPATRHPSLLDDGKKWLIECHSLPALPDPSGQSPAGVGGLMVMAHGEFDEVNVATGQATVTRSFDRTFILGPGSGPTGVRVLSDMLTYRAYGGFEAWIPEDGTTTTNHVPAGTQPAPPITDGLGMGVNGKSAEQVHKEQMVIEMSKRTNMTLPYSQLCLEEIGYDFDGALAAFESVKANLPPDAFMS
ncbi:MAG: nuclear mRNA export, poly(A)+RNA binding protein [Thelocarpon superellum]|nr:MAG: nuclear mRNA export, poly(A)+RNA binding protein [Thelocarpon superellum]